MKVKAFIERGNDGSYGVYVDLEDNTLNYGIIGDGKTIKEIWKNRQVQNSFGGFVKIDNQLFSTSKDNKLKCLDTKTGIVVDSIRSLRGSVIYADDQLYCYNDNGNVNLINLSGVKMEVISKFKIDKGTKEHFSNPVIGNGVLYIRHGNALMAYEIK